MLTNRLVPTSFPRSNSRVVRPPNALARPVSAAIAHLIRRYTSCPSGSPQAGSSIGAASRRHSHIAPETLRRYRICYCNAGIRGELHPIPALSARCALIIESVVSEWEDRLMRIAALLASYSLAVALPRDRNAVLMSGLRSP